MTAIRLTAAADLATATGSSRPIAASKSASLHARELTFVPLHSALPVKACAAPTSVAGRQLGSAAAFRAAAPPVGSRTCFYRSIVGNLASPCCFDFLRRALQRRLPKTGAATSMDGCRELSQRCGNERLSKEVPKISISISTGHSVSNYGLACGILWLLNVLSIYHCTKPCVRNFDRPPPLGPSWSRSNIVHTSFLSQYKG